ncbi:PTS transporter subunit EIIC [Streptomyces sp. WMMB 322]|uniref:PTS transporter subunit EIIC n=1 Tax=Streptomyces sp. WMMB 322 TaxID=1286821 RepID=UPI0008237B04|nr:PTS transporter subunit EIIC [Streptomyces sp. WMMB 322]SCK06909.1 PTS system IIB component, Glc family (TC 4.A.1)/PTS system IIC component, Glc family (TC 4.A.1) [Streptomyces sp. WMMB 322]
MSKDKNRQIAEALLPLVGGSRNVVSITHCMTRLRLGLADRSLVRDSALRALPDVVGVVEDDDTYQIVLGPGKVARVTTELQAIARQETATAADTADEVPATAAADAAAGGQSAVTAEGLAERGAAIRAARRRKNATPVKQMLRRVANIFVPLIPALIGCGIVAGINGILTNLVSSGSAQWAAGIVPALTAISTGFMSLIAVFVGINTAAEFGGTPVLGGAAAAVIVFADVAKVSAFGAKLAPGQGGVLGALFAALVAVHVEKWCRRRVPEAVDVLVTPTVTVLVSGLVTLFGLMYVCGLVSAGIGHFANWLLLHGGALAGFVLGGLFLPLVMLGLHQALIPIHTTLIEQDGFTVLLPVLAMAGAGQVGAAVAVYVRLRRNTSIRKTIKSALPAGVMGVGEPLIYGVSLPLGRPFITACAGGAVGGGAVGLFHQLGTSVGSTAIGPSGWALFPLLKGNQGLGAIALVYALGMGTGYLAGFVATYFFGFSRQMLTELNVAPEASAAGTVVARGTPAPASRVPQEHRDRGEDDDGDGAGGDGGGPGGGGGEPKQPVGV